MAQSLGCEVASHPFDNYSQQRNWAQTYAALAPDDWVLHLDSDEVLSPEFAGIIRRTLELNPAGVDGYLMRRLNRFGFAS